LPTDHCGDNAPTWWHLQLVEGGFEGRAHNEGMMADIEQQYPEISEYLDHSGEYENAATEFKQGSDRYLLVTQLGVDGQQLLFKWNGTRFEFSDNDTIIDNRSSTGAWWSTFAEAKLDASITTCGASSQADHEKVYQYLLTQVNVFDSSKGPGGGGLACCWTVRFTVYGALKRWITQTDGTAEFGQELHNCFHAASNEGAALPGGLVISPTKDIPGSKARNIGHVGFLGDGAGDQRIIYSNSSRDKKLEQNFTVGSWKAYYSGQKKLDVLFYALPIRSIAATS
jgi:hypothetical protein